MLIDDVSQLFGIRTFGDGIGQGRRRIRVQQLFHKHGRAECDEQYHAHERICRKESGVHSAEVVGTDECVLVGEQGSDGDDADECGPGEAGDEIENDKDDERLEVE